MRSLPLVLLSILLLCACGSKRGEEVRKGTLVERVGQSDGLNQAIADFVERIPADDVVGPRFTSVDLKAFEANLANEMCVQIGGNCAPKASMLAEVGLTDDEYDAFVELFVESMNAVEYPSKEQNDLIDALFALREKHSGTTAAKGAAK